MDKGFFNSIHRSILSHGDFFSRKKKKSEADYGYNNKIKQTNLTGFEITIKEIHISMKQSCSLI